MLLNQSKVNEPGIKNLIEFIYTSAMQINIFHLYVYKVKNNLCTIWMYYKKY